ncbi:Multifunctional CCA protein [Candidatus Methylomirabilis lanthanidiphila]|uniref:Multifunctional CCA protein n=1 Tax=Candidatus Methylomirabilis lanthanidiphila TaxID=2211376 RepID=A0A564ZEB6_9BACT|nr:CCA tRNA nucleotidyltransferase [Candidatus Methylomirabilis lanthanidiphila]VUZ83661.1 Multifunctional CCA protein [Candidatus Methylomirabilis lanthanidiphila]
MQLPQFRELDPLSRMALETARRAAAPVPIYAVGGYVRDLLLGRQNVDIDLVVEGDAITVARRLAHSLQAVVTPHPRFGTAHLRLPGGRGLDLATARSERYPHTAALPEVQPAPLLADLLRRDFSINAMAVRIDRHRFGPLIDPLGGLRDLEHGRIRTLHEQSFIDDPTRLFRTARFEGRYRFLIARSTLQLMKAAVKVGAITHLTGPRIFRELHLIAKEPSAPRIIWRLRDLGVLTAIHPRLTLPAAAFGLLERVRQVLNQAPSVPLLEKADESEALLLAMLYLLHPKTVVAVLKRLAPPHRIAEKLATDHKACRNAAQTLTRAVDLRQSRMARLLDPLSPEARVVLLAVLAKGPAQEAVSRYLTTSSAIIPLLKGADLRHLGFRPGPIYRTILIALRTATLDGRLHTKEDQMSFVLQRFAGERLRH